MQVLAVRIEVGHGLLHAQFAAVTFQQVLAIQQAGFQVAHCGFGGRQRGGFRFNLGRQGLGSGVVLVGGLGLGQQLLQALAVSRKVVGEAGQGGSRRAVQQFIALGAAGLPLVLNGLLTNQRRGFQTLLPVQVGAGLALVPEQLGAPGLAGGNFFLGTLQVNNFASQRHQLAF